MPFLTSVVAEFHGHSQYHANFAQTAIHYNQANSLTHILCFPECSPWDHCHNGSCCRPLGVTLTSWDISDSGPDFRHASYIGEIVRASERHQDTGIHPTPSESHYLHYRSSISEKFRGKNQCHKFFVLSTGARMLSVTIYFNNEGKPYTYARPMHINFPQKFTFKISVFGVREGEFYRMGYMFSPEFAVYNNIFMPSPCMTIRHQPLSHYRYINGILMNPPGSAETVQLRIEDGGTTLEEEDTPSYISRLYTVHQAYMNMLYEHVLPTADIIEDEGHTDGE